MANEDDDLKYLSYTLPGDIARKLARGGIDVQNEFGGGRELTDEDRNIGWGDIGRGVAAGAINIAGGQAANVEYLSGGAYGSETRKYLDELSDEQLEMASRQFRRAAQSAFFPSGGQESIFDVGLTDAILAKGAMTLPSLVAAIIPAGAVGLAMRGSAAAGTAAGATAKGAASLMNMGDMAGQIYKEVDKLSDEELAKQSSVYSGYLLMGMNPKEARTRFRQDVVGAAPLAAAAITYATGGLEGMVGARFGGEAAKGFLRGYGKGFVAEGLQEVAEGGGNEMMAQEALSKYNIGEKDWLKVLNSAVEGFALGGLMGGPIGGLANIDIKGKPRVPQTTGDATQDAALNPQGKPLPPPRDVDLRGELDRVSDDINRGKQDFDRLKNGIDPAQAAALGVTGLTDEDIEDFTAGIFTPKDIWRGVDTRSEADKAGSNNEPAPRPRAPMQDIPFDGPSAPMSDVFPGDLPSDPSMPLFTAPQRPITAAPAPVAPRGGDTGQNIPEAPADLNAQRQQLMQGRRVAMLYPVGTPEGELPRNMKRVVTDAGVFHYNPNKIDETTIKYASARGKENELLGLGPFDKQAIMRRIASGEKPVAVTETTPDGATARSAVGTEQTAPVQQQAIQQVASPENTVQVEPINAPLERRATGTPAPKPVQVPPKAKAAKAVSKAKEQPVDLLAVQQEDPEVVKNAPDEAREGVRALWTASNSGEVQKAESMIRQALPLDEARALIAQVKSQKGEVRVKKIDRKAAKQAIKDAKEAAERGDEEAAAEARRRISASLPREEAKAATDALLATGKKKLEDDLTPLQRLEIAVRKAGDEYVAAKAAGNIEEMQEAEERLFELLPNEAIFKQVMNRLRRDVKPDTKATPQQAARSRAAQKSNSEIEGPKKTLTEEERATELKKQEAEQKEDRRRKFDTSAKALNTTDANAEEILAAKDEVKLGDVAGASAVEKVKPSPVRKVEASAEEKEKLVATQRKEVAEKGAKGKAVVRKAKDKSEGEIKRADKEQRKADSRLARTKKKIEEQYAAKGLKVGSAVIDQQAKALIAAEDRKASKKKGVGSGQLDITRVLSATETATETPSDEAITSKQVEQEFGGDPDAQKAAEFQQAIEGRNVLEILEYIIANPDGENYSIIASRVLDRIRRLMTDVGMKFDVQIVNPGDKVPGAFIGSRGLSITDFVGTLTNKIYLAGKDLTGYVGMSQKTVLHEIIHAAADAAIRAGYATYIAPQKYPNVAPELTRLYGELSRVRVAFVRHFNNRVKAFQEGKGELTPYEQYLFTTQTNVATDVYELVTWGLTDANFQEYLRGIPLDQQQNLLDKMLQVIAEFFGFRAQQGTAFYEFLKATDELFTTDPLRMHQQLSKLTSKLDPIAAPQIDGPATPENFTQRVTTNIMSSVSAAATDAVRTTTNVGDKARKLVMKIMTNDHLRQAAERVGPEFGEAFFKVTDALERLGVKGRKYMERGNEVAERLYKLRRQDKDLFQRFADLAMDATVNDIHPDRDINDKIHEYMFKRDGTVRPKYIQAFARHAELHAEYNNIISANPEYETAYREATTYFTEMQNALTRANIEGVLIDAGDTIKLPAGKTQADLADWIFNGGLDIPVTGDVGNIPPAMVTQAEAYREALGEKLVNHMSNIMSLKKIKGAYFPLMRRGNFVIQGYEKFDTMGGRYDREEGAVYFKDEQEAQRFAATTDIKVVDIKEVAVGPDGKRTYTDPEGNTKYYTLADMDTEPVFEVKVQNKYVEFFDNVADAKDAHAKAAASGDFEELSGVQNRRDQSVNLTLTDRQVQILVRSVQQREGLDDAQRKVLVDSIIQSAITLMPGSRVQHRRKPRRYVAGASDDLVQNTLDYSTSAGNYLAKQELGRDVSNGMKELREAHDALKYANGDSTLERDNLVAELERRIASDPVAQEEKTSPWVRTLLTLSFLDKLASPAYSLINAMQPWMVTMPVLSAKYGFMPAQRALTQAYRDIGGIDTVRTGLSDTIRMWKEDKGTDFITTYKDRLKKAYPGSKGEQLAALVDYLAERGAIDANAGLEIARLNEINNVAGRGLNRAELMMRAMPTAIEAMNRTTTAVAEYNLAREAGLSHEAAMKAALTQVNNTQGNYSATNAPPIFNHPLARIALQFKKYGQMMYHLLGQNVYHAFKGATPAERAQAQKVLFNLAVAHTALAGMLGLPLEPIKLLLLPIGLLGGPDYDDLEDALRQAAAKYLGNRGGEVLMKGLPRLFGFDLSSRVGLDSLMTFGSPRDNTERDLKVWLTDTVIGAPGGLIVDWGKGLSDIAHGDMMKGFEKLVPLKVVSDSLRAYREGTEGKVTKAGRQSMEPTNAAEMGLRAFGISPASVVRRGERDRVFYRTQKEGVTERQEMMGAWLNAPKAERGRQWDKIRKWNDGKGDAQRITLEDLKRADKRRETENKRGQIKDGYRVTKRDEEAYARSEIYR